MGRVMELFVAVFQKELVSGFRNMNVGSLDSFAAGADTVSTAAPARAATFFAIIMLVSPVVGS